MSREIEKPSIFGLSVSITLLACGVILATVELSFGVIPTTMNVLPIRWETSVAIGIVALGLLAISGLRLPRQIGTLKGNAEKQGEPKRSTELYGIYLGGIGFALLLQALGKNIVLFGTLFRDNRFDGGG